MSGSFPTVRPRRLRGERIRELVRETRLSPSQLVLPLFVVPGRGQAVPVPSMPGVKQWSVDRVAEEASRAYDAGVRSVILFGIPEAKDATGSHSWRDDGVVQEALRALRRERVALRGLFVGRDPDVADRLRCLHANKVH